MFLGWTSSWSLWMTLLRRPLTAFNRIIEAVSWLWINQERRIPIEQDVASSREGSAVRKDPGAAPVKDAIPVAEVEHCVRASKGDFIAGGASGIVERLPSGDVVKSPWPGSRAADCCPDLRSESQIYKKLGCHPRLVQIIDWDPTYCILTMEYMSNGTLKDFLSANNDTVSTAQRLQWAQEAAEGLQLLHVADVIHCDVEPKNFLLDANLGLKIADFSGSSFEGSQASACAGKRFSPPDFDWRRQPTVEDDLFGLGSTIYCIMTGQHPFQELPSDEVEDKYRAHQFPDVTKTTCGSIIKRCWNSEAASAQEIYNLIKNTA